ncbi:NAD(P)/FAD-dependent oxidoreductase [Actinomadura hibisca]|uniref:NAD(P)/FAD-dependent oxidoreductase n=1 Tax=Actinomadura hibisca TaxID=68565 RepID=UPI00082A3D8D|nr:FAD/NAD(P)-binding oxidoreductase [Actinomadura hibisca]
MSLPSQPRRIVIAGASLAGLRAAQSLRAEGFAGDITLVGAEPRPPYNRPPLSKSVLTGDDDVTLPGDEVDAHWLGGRRAISLDVAGRRVAVDDGSDLPYDGLVIATGARPRRLAEDQMGYAGVHVLRTVEHAQALRAGLGGVAGAAGRVVVIGGGFIGGEVASTARSLGAEVTLVEAGELPMAGVVGEVAAGWLAEHHRRNGVELITGMRVVGLVGEGGEPGEGGEFGEGWESGEGRRLGAGRGARRVRAVRLDGGREVAADLVVVAIGVVPNTEWLEGSGLTLDDGVVTDQALFAAPDVVAAGDVVRWPHGLFGERVRVEHWANANDQGLLAARNLLRGPAEAEPYAEVPGLGTRVHGARVQWAGLPHLGDASHLVAGKAEDDKFAVAFTRGGILVGAAAVAFPKELNRLRRGIVAGSALAAG